MRKIVLILALALAVPVMGVSVVSCSSGWVSNFVNNPAVQVQAFEQGVNVVMANAQTAWTFAQPFLPSGQSAQITQQYNNAVFAVNHALQVLNDGVSAAVAANNSNPNFTALMAAVTDAVQQVLAVIAQYSPAPAPAVVEGGVALARLSPVQSALTDATLGLANLVSNYHLQ